MGRTPYAGDIQAPQEHWAVRRRALDRAQNKSAGHYPADLIDAEILIRGKHQAKHFPPSVAT